MQTTALTSAHFARSVMAVPPLARATNRSLAHDANARIVRHLEAGGVSLMLYGGNANFYHLPLGEYDEALAMLAAIAGPETMMVPSAGPTYALLLEHAKVIRRHAFPCVMVLPQQGITTSTGVANGIREFAAAAGVPVIVYVKNDGYIEPEDVAALDREGIVSAIKYAVVRRDAGDDAYLRKLVSLVDTSRIISGIGEQPAIVHVRDFGLGGFTSGCVCVAPRLSQAMLAAVRRQDWAEAERIRAVFKPLEDLRNAINPIRVLHQAVEGAGIAETGPLLPLLTNVDAADVPAIATAALDLLAADTRGIHGV
ncbi:MAG: dihydrodipicolinate synthase family protein [Acidobacteria bacterium]|nr:dihydrodipicolinate synthase family protein [Acidobacteriota bacterium]